MVKYFFLCLLFVFVACSSRKDGVSEPYDLERSMKLIDEIDAVYVFGPTDKEAKLFVDKTKDYGLEGYKGYNFNVVDLDADGYSDLVILESFYSTPIFLRFNPDLKKFEKFDHDFFSERIKASYLLFYDFNNDGIIDVLVGVLNQKTEIEKIPLRVFWGTMEEGKLLFKKSDSSINLPPGPHASVIPLDFNLDGSLDLFVGNWFDLSKAQPVAPPDILLKNEKGVFKDVSDLLDEEYAQNPSKTSYTNATPTYSASLCDIDQNGFPDILTASTNGGQNRLWLNLYALRKNRRYFKDFGLESRYASDSEGYLNPYGGGRTFTSICADYNNDGIMDVFLGEVTHSYDPETYDKSSILTGSRLKFPPKFIRTEYFKESFSTLWHQSDKRAIFEDFNNNGLLDLLVDNSGYPPHTRLILFEQNDDHSFEDRSKDYGIDILNPTSTVYLDINGDGKLDILTGQINIRNSKIKERIYLFENQTTTKAQTYRIFLRGEKSNLWGIGASLIFKIKKGKEIIYKRRHVEYSYGGLPPQNELGIHFALPEGEELLWVKVRWPFAKSLDTDVTKLEKIYTLPKVNGEHLNITLCESGSVKVGKMRACSR